MLLGLRDGREHLPSHAFGPVVERAEGPVYVVEREGEVDHQVEDVYNGMSSRREARNLTQSQTPETSNNDFSQNSRH